MHQLRWFLDATTRYSFYTTSVANSTPPLVLTPHYCLVLSRQYRWYQLRSAAGTPAGTIARY
eukprot:2435426-Rhodomonas_salina.1